MENKEMEKLNTEELDQVAGGGYLDDAIDTATNTVKNRAAIAGKGIEAVKTSKDALGPAGLAALKKAASNFGKGF